MTMGSRPFPSCGKAGLGLSPPSVHGGFSLHRSGQDASCCSELGLQGQVLLIISD